MELLASAALSWSSAESDSIPESYGWALLRMALALVVVCLLAYLIARYGLRGLAARRDRGAKIRIIERRSLQPGRSLSLIRVGERVMLIGDSERHICKLADLSEADLRDGAPTFADRLSEASPEVATDASGSRDQS